MQVRTDAAAGSEDYRGPAGHVVDLQRVPRRVKHGPGRRLGDPLSASVTVLRVAHQGALGDVTVSMADADAAGLTGGELLVQPRPGAAHGERAEPPPDVIGQEFHRLARLDATSSGSTGPCRS